MLLAFVVFMCVLGALLLVPVLLVLALFFLNKNVLMRASFGEDFRVILNKFMADMQSRASSNTQSDLRGGISQKEALEILGLSPNASREQIIAAYHRLMKNSHPDRGGSAYFAQKLNQARDSLLGNK